MKKTEIKVGDSFHMPVGHVLVREVGDRMVTVEWIGPDGKKRLGKMDHSRILKYPKDPRVSTVDENGKRAHLVARETGN